jgi:type I restriction enzyme S subunit
MQRYEKYKDSGVEWIGEIPDGWEVVSLRRLTEEHKQGYYTTTSYVQNGTKLIRISDLDSNGKIDFTTAPYVEISSIDKESYSLKIGDFIFPRTGSIGLFGMVSENQDAVFASYLIRFRFNKKITSQFLQHFFRSSVFLDGLLSDLHGGVNQNIHAENIKEQLICLPPYSDQLVIANYLSHKTAEIDNLIAQKERLIELYEEEKAAIINQVVTKGIDPDAKMKDSGVDWLGEIPEGWEVKKLKYSVLKVGSGITPKGGASAYELTGVPLLRSQNIHFNGLRLDDVAYINQKTHDIMANTKVLSGDVLLNITGASIGRCYYVDDLLGEANVNRYI